MNGINEIDIENNCSVCLQTILSQNLCITNCYHKYCKECLDKWFNTGKSSCPMCRTDIIYFKHLDKDTRVICITEKNRPTLNNNNDIMIQHKLFVFLLFGSVGGFISVILILGIFLADL